MRILFDKCQIDNFLKRKIMKGFNNIYKKYIHCRYVKDKTDNVLKKIEWNINTNQKKHITNISLNQIIKLWNYKYQKYYSTETTNLYLQNYEAIKQYINNIQNEEVEIITILKEKTYECIKKTKDKILSIIKSYPDIPISVCTPTNVIGGLRNVITLITDTSILDSKKGIMFRGKSVDILLKELTKWDDKYEYPSVEAMLWFLLTNKIPTRSEIKLLSKELYKRANLIPKFVFDFIDNIPTYTHPMSQLICTISFLESFSLFKYKYSEGIHKKDHWKYILEDAISLFSQILLIGPYIYKRTFIDNNIKGGDNIEINENLDWSGNFAKLIEYDSNDAKDLFRLYFILHSDHEGGNASSHASHLVGSTLGNPYLAYLGCIAALAGPLHGLANQECLNFILDIKKELGNNKINSTFIENYARNVLNSGKVIPGYGHAVLRVDDPRFLALRNFGLNHFKNDPLIEILEMCYKTIPNILSSTGKVKNPHPNVDFYSGALLYHYGMKYPQYYTVLFALSRTIGVMSQLIISRGLMLPLERPKSIDLYHLEKQCKLNLTNDSLKN